MVVEWIAIGISLAAIGISIWTWKKPRPIEKQQADTNSMSECIKILGDPNVKEWKQKIANGYWSFKDRNQPVIFTTGSASTAAYKVRQAFNNVSIFYQRSLLNKEYFRDAYGGTLVRFWNILKEDIENDQKNNPDICKHFKAVAIELINDHKITAEPYRSDKSEIGGKILKENSNH